MRCPYCGSDDVYNFESRKSEDKRGIPAKLVKSLGDLGDIDFIMRRKRCRNCFETFATVEILAYKKDRDAFRKTLGGVEENVS